MAKVTSTVAIAAPLADVWEMYFDPVGWPAWVDQFGSVETSDAYPQAGGTLRWRSGRAGRGTVTERVLEHEPRSLHRVAFEDPESSGELEVAFAIEPGGIGTTRVTQTMDYAISGAGPLTPITDLFFVRPQVRRSLERSLARLRAEVEARQSGGG